MLDWLLGAALWIKALHVMAVISWMAGLFYLPRLFVYHAEAQPGSDAVEMFKLMEEKLLRIIMRPAMAVTWLTGLYLVWAFEAWQAPWFWVKGVLILAMSAFHEKCAKWQKQFAADENTRNGKFYRLANEVPTLLMIGIVIMVIVKPF